VTSCCIKQCLKDEFNCDYHPFESYQNTLSLTGKLIMGASHFPQSICERICRTVYKQWLCSQYFQTTQVHCSRRIPCGHYCLQVQQRCPFILPDNDDLIHGGSPSFICTGLLEDHPSGVDPGAECCDVRWDLKVESRSRGTLRRTHPPCQHRTSLSSSAACRLCNSRLKLCLLVLVLLHTVASLTASHNATGMGLPAITSLEESPANEE
uniref:Family with sequence similarity 155 member A n=1 Tax=Tetraodon nigroviridis TaxID=99883 RepID=H3D8U2_TETNG